MELCFVELVQRSRDEDDTVALQVESDEIAEPPEMKRELEEALHKTQAAAFAKGTVKNLLCQWRSFIRFYIKYNLKQWPVPEHNMCLYAQFLAYNFKSVRSVRSYLYGVRTLHVLLKVDPPNMLDIEMKLTLRGLNKWLISPVKQAQPLTPEMLIDMVEFLDLRKHADFNFWGSLLIGFFSMFRKSNLMSDTLEGFDPARQLTRGHISFRGELAIVKVTWTKTIQYRQKVLEILIFPIPNSPLCPVRVLKLILRKSGRPSHLLFGTRSKIAFTYNQWQRKF